MSTNPNLSFRAVEVFVAVVEQGSVTGAAKRLGASPSTVSQQLANLETSLGARLIERSARTFMLTTAGEIFLPRALKLLDDVSGARAALSEGASAPAMMLRIAVIEDLDRAVTPYWLTHLSPALGACTFAVRGGASHENHSALADRTADLIVAVDAWEAPDWVEAHPLLRDPYILVTAPDIPDDANLTTIMKRPMVRYSREQYMSRQIEAQLRRVGAAPARGMELSSSIGVLATVTASGGWAITTALAYLGASVSGDQLKARPAPLPSFSRTISLYARRNALSDLPGICAANLRDSLTRTSLADAQQRLPFIQDTLAVLG
ncbi:MAG: LysR family transcriptional regulator [Pikeienuella sp.]